MNTTVNVDRDMSELDGIKQLLIEPNSGGAQVRIWTRSADAIEKDSSISFQVPPGNLAWLAEMLREAADDLDKAHCADLERQLAFHTAQAAEITAKLGSQKA